MLNLPRQARDKHRENSKQILRKNAATRFLSVFPLFVPSLSWQNDPFCIKSVCVGGGGVVLPGADRFERVLLELLQDGLLGLQRLL
eukprot:COSAG06_NODE_3642_length_5083_cov_40.822632_7_plen_85_part_01